MNTSVVLGGLKLKNPLILGSAGYTSSEAGLKNQLTRGYGAVVTKTVTPGALEGAPNPRVFWYDPDDKRLLSGAEALRNPGADVMIEAVRKNAALAESEGCKIIGSCTANTKEEIIDICQRFEDAGVSAIELNLVCPATGPHLGPDYAHLAKWWVTDYDRAADLLNSVKEKISVPLFAKINLEVLLDCRFMAMLDEKARPDAYSFVGGRMPNLTIDIATGKPVFPGNLHLRMEKGMPISPMCTGPVKPSTILHTAYFAKLTSTPLVCAGGLSKGTDVLEAIMAGASAVQVSTVVYREGNDAGRRILAELNEAMEKYGYEELEPLKGAVLDSLPEPPLLTVPGAKGFV